MGGGIEGGGGGNGRGSMGGGAIVNKLTSVFMYCFAYVI